MNERVASAASAATTTTTLKEDDCDENNMGTHCSILSCLNATTPNTAERTNCLTVVSTRPHRRRGCVVARSRGTATALQGCAVAYAQFSYSSVEVRTFLLLSPPDRC